MSDLDQTNNYRYVIVGEKDRFTHVTMGITEDPRCNLSYFLQKVMFRMNGRH